MSQNTKMQAAALLARGLPLTVVAAQLAVTPSYLSQLTQDSEYQRYYQQLIDQQRIVTHSTTSKIDGHYDSLELGFAELLDSQKEVVFASLVQDPKTLLAAMRTFNGLKRRSVGEAVAPEQSGLVALSLPTFLVDQCTPVVKHNAQNEVIEVDGRTLVSATDKALKSQLASLVQIPAPAALAEPLDPALLGG